MNKIIKISLVLLTFIGFVSCDSSDDDTSYLNDRTSVSYFVPGSTGTLLVEEGVVSTFNVMVGISEPKPFDRSFTYSIDPSSTAVLNSDFTISSTLIIPANSVVGSISVTGDYDTSTLTGKTVKLVLNSVDDSVLGARKVFTLNLIRYCPIPSSFFTGTYMIQQVSGNAPFGIGFAFGGNQIVEVSALTNTTRTFNYLYAPGAFDSPYYMNLDLICGSVFVSGTIQPGNGTLGCGNGSIGQSTGSTPGSYDINDDAEVTVNILDFEPDSGCGTNYQAVIKLIKQ